MNRSLCIAGAMTLCGVLATSAGAAQNRNSQATTCHPAKASQQRTDGTVRSLHADAERGDVEAMNALAIMYAQGVGVAKSACMAMKLFRQSAGEGYAPAMVNLGMMHAVSEDMRRDASQAYAWIRAALYVGVPDEERDATVFKLGMVASRLDVSQVERAEVLARQIALSVAARRSPSVEKERETPDSASRT